MSGFTFTADEGRERLAALLNGDELSAARATGDAAGLAALTAELRAAAAAGVVNPRAIGGMHSQTASQIVGYAKTRFAQITREGELAAARANGADARIVALEEERRWCCEVIAAPATDVTALRAAIMGGAS
jgi:hypothetical protein